MENAVAKRRPRGTVRRMRPKIPVCSLIVAALSCATLRAASDWPEFRGPTGDGISDAKDVPLEWSAAKNVAWSVEIPGRGWSSPSLRGGRLYLTTAVVTDGSDEGNPKADRSLRALCLDAATGRTEWDVEVFRQEGSKAPDSIHKKNGHASPTPIVTDDGRVYVHFGHQGTACLDAAGKKIWENRSLSYPPVHGNGPSPVLVDGRLIFPCDGASDPFLVALEAGTGRVSWKKKRPATEQKQKFSFATCAVFEIDGKRQLVSPFAGAVDGIDPATGDQLWRVRYEGYSVVPKPLYKHGLIFVSSAYDTPDVYAIDPAGARGDVTESHVKWSSGKKAPMTVAPLVVGPDIYWVSDQGGLVTCADALTGEVHWSERLPSVRAVSAAPLFADGRIYILDEEGTTHVLAPGHDFKVLASNPLGDRALASITPTDGGLFIRTETKLWRVGTK